MIDKIKTFSLFQGNLQNNNLMIHPHSATFNDSKFQNNQPGKINKSRNEIDFPIHCSVLPWPIHTEPSSKGGRIGIQP